MNSKSFVNFTRSRCTTKDYETKVTTSRPIIAAASSPSWRHLVIVNWSMSWF